MCEWGYSYTPLHQLRKHPTHFSLSHGGGCHLREGKHSEEKGAALGFTSCDTQKQPSLGTREDALLFRCSFVLFTTMAELVSGNLCFGCEPIVLCPTPRVGNKYMLEGRRYRG